MKGKGSLLILVLLVCIVAVIAATRYYDYTENDPDFCSLCHLMQEGYKTWIQSRHNTLVCQGCHRLDLLEENKLLVGFVAGGHSGIKQEHGRNRPWEGCLKCHSQDAAQGSVTLRLSYGHARHVFMQNISCRSCHKGDTHALTADPKLCTECHKDKLVHGMGTAGLDCLNCHHFGESSPQMVASERCFSCHPQVQRTGVMSGLKCHDCHHPHKKLRMENDDCLKTCHANQANVGRHGLHKERAGMSCMDCHKPHHWVIGRAEAKGLCDRCHPRKDPASFIY